MTFEANKKNTLFKIINLDKSKKGSIDLPVLDLVNFINAHDDLYTTSSCSGRILLIHFPDNARKCDANWLLAKHDFVDFETLSSALNKSPDDGQVWLKFEPLILHVAVRNIDFASIILKSLHDSGIKRSGAITLSPKVILEVIGTKNLAVPVKLNGSLIVEDSKLRALLEICNDKMKQNFQDIDKIFNLIKKV